MHRQAVRKTALNHNNHQLSVTRPKRRNVETYYYFLFNLRFFLIFLIGHNKCQRALRYGPAHAPSPQEELDFSKEDSGSVAAGDGDCPGAPGLLSELFRPRGWGRAPAGRRGRGCWSSPKVGGKVGASLLVWIPNEVLLVPRKKNSRLICTRYSFFSFSSCPWVASFALRLTKTPRHGFYRSKVGVIIGVGLCLHVKNNSFVPI